MGTTRRRCTRSVLQLRQWVAHDDGPLRGSRQPIGPRRWLQAEVLDLASATTHPLFLLPLRLGPWFATPDLIAPQESGPSPANRLTTGAALRAYPSG